MYDAIRSVIAQAVPFAKYVGVELLEVGDGVAKARLEQRPELSNHIGTMHAGALFALAETASGAAVAGMFKDVIGGLRPVAAEATISYLKLTKGMASCAAATAEPAETLRGRLEAERKAIFDVSVEIFREDGQTVAKMSVRWHVRFAAAGD
jgi:uncharacterized protein (TIGR00369 family)